MFDNEHYSKANYRQIKTILCNTNTRTNITVSQIHKVCIVLRSHMFICVVIVVLDTQ